MLPDIKDILNKIPKIICTENLNRFLGGIPTENLNCFRGCRFDIINDNLYYCGYLSYHIESFYESMCSDNTLSKFYNDPEIQTILQLIYSNNSKKMALLNYKHPLERIQQLVTFYISPTHLKCPMVK